MKHSPLYIPTDGVAVVIDAHASGSVAHDIDGTASVVIGTQSVSCEPLNIERKRTACVPASGIKRIVANHSKCIIAQTEDTQRRLDHGAPLVMVPALPVIGTNSDGLR